MHHQVVSREKWLNARRAHLAKEKEFTRLRDQLSQERRDLPWVKVEKTYTFDGPQGKETLADLFDGRSQLLVYHFMYDPAWDEGCKSCSFLADHYDPAVIHLKQRDVSMVTVSRAPLAQLQAYQKRMGWSFKWVSSFDSDFNYDYNVSFTDNEAETGEVYYNFKQSPYFSSEGPGISAFCRDEDGTIYHTYSGYARGLDMFLGTYHLLDIVPKGRDESDLPYSMDWVRRHDEYGQ